jgi:hypothetical protein
MDEIKTLRETAIQTEELQKTRNICELPSVSIDFEVKEDSFTDKEGELVVYKYLHINGEKYRIPKSVLNNLKAILEDNPNLKSFKVRKTGEGMETRYTVIPLS